LVQLSVVDNKIQAHQPIKISSIDRSEPGLLALTTNGTDKIALKYFGGLFIADLPSAGAVAQSQVFLAAPTFSLNAGSRSVNEGAVAVFVLSTTEVAPGTIFSYSIEGIQREDLQDFGSLTQDAGGVLTGRVTLGSDGKASISIPIAADNLTEGPETMTVTVRSLQGTNLASASVVLNDTSTGGSSGGNTGGGTTGGGTTGGGTTGGGTTGGGTTGGGTSGGGTTGGGTTGGGTTGGGTGLIPVPGTGGSGSATGSGAVRPSGNRVDGTEGSELLNGTSGVDQIYAKGGNDTIVGSSGSDYIDGGAGLDLVRYNGSSMTATIAKLATGEVTVRRGSETDTLVNVERLQFTDQWIAIDINGNAGTAARMIVTAFGKSVLTDYSGIGISLVDSGWTATQLAELIISAGFMPARNNDFVKVVFENVTGRAPNALEITIFAQMLNDGTYTQAGLLALAAESPLAQATVEESAIGLVGIPYQPSLF